MIIADIRLVANGTEKLLGRVKIVNDLKGTLDLANYDVELTDEPPFTENGRRGVWRKARVVGFERRRFGPYHLLFRALRAAIIDEAMEADND